MCIGRSSKRNLTNLFVQVRDINASRREGRRRRKEGTEEREAGWREAGSEDGTGRESCRIVGGCMPGETQEGGQGEGGMWDGGGRGKEGGIRGAARGREG